MIDPIWSDLDARLGKVKRYNLFQTIQTQTVAEHIFNVERLSRRILFWFRFVVPAPNPAAVFEWAHHHEDFEALSGDFPAMAKPYFDEARFEKDHNDLRVIYKPDQLTRDIVKMADIMDCYLFFAMELQLGNRYTEKHFDAMELRLYKFADKVVCRHDGLRDLVTEVAKFIDAHRKPHSRTNQKDGWSEDRL